VGESDRQRFVGCGSVLHAEGAGIGGKAQNGIVFGGGVHL
jgi:hypothetical protein